MRIRIVYHVFAAHRWETVARSLVTKLVWSGLYDACRDVSVVAYGPERERTPAFFVRFGRKIHVTVAGGGGVARTLRGLRDTVGAGEAVLFLHTKGTDVAEPSESLEDWREFMDYWLIARWRECTSALNSHDVAGCNRNRLSTHFENQSPSVVNGDRAPHLLGVAGQYCPDFAVQADAVFNDRLPQAAGDCAEARLGEAAIPVRKLLQVARQHQIKSVIERKWQLRSSEGQRGCGGNR
jgi:hypothetical protein